MKIVIAIWSLRMGGAEMFSKHLAKELLKRGHDVYLFPLFDPYDLSVLSVIQREKIPILIPIKTGLFSWMIWKLNALFVHLFSFRFRDYLTQHYFLNQIKKKRIQLVISNSSMTDEFMAKNLLEIPFLSVEHGQYSIAITDREVIDRKALGKAAQVVSVSRWCAALLNEQLKIDSKVIYSGHLKNENMDGLSETIDRKIFTFTMIARGVSQKGWDVAIKAFLKVIVTKQAKLVLVGTGEYLLELQKSYNHPAIVFKGQMDSINQVIHETDIGLFPSRKYEAFGLSILDFFSQGKPVLASDLGGIPEVISDSLGAGGLLIQLNDGQEPDVNHLSALMAEVMDKESLRSELSKNALRLAERFDFQKTVDEYEQVCVNVMRK